MKQPSKYNQSPGQAQSQPSSEVTQKASSLQAKDLRVPKRRASKEEHQQFIKMRGAELILKTRR